MRRRIRPSLLVWAFIPYVAVSIAHVMFLAARDPLHAPTKLALMPLLAVPILLFAPRLRPRATLGLLLAAVALSWLGDGAGTFFPAAPELPLMLLFFGLAHLAYMALFWRYLRRTRMAWWTLIYAAWWVGMLAVLWTHVGALLPAVAVYGIVLGGTAALAARCHPLVAWGGAFFLLSDTILALRLFLPTELPHWTSPAVMLTYTLGQGLIIAGALVWLTRRKRT